jgi:hypothetical protein
VTPKQPLSIRETDLEYVIVCIAALLASGLTLFSGFGLGTLLMPVVAILSPLEIAIAITAVVHFTHNLFKLALMGHHADRSILLKFGIPAVIAAFIGAALLNWLYDADGCLWRRGFGLLRGHAVERRGGHLYFGIPCGVHWCKDS